jgi:Tfp pilus assembly protein PilN
MRYKYHIGLDTHSTNSTFAVMDNRGKVLRIATVATSERELLGFLRSLRGTKALTFEDEEDSNRQKRRRAAEWRVGAAREAKKETG